MLEQVFFDGRADPRNQRLDVERTRVFRPPDQALCAGGDCFFKSMFFLTQVNYAQQKAMLPRSLDARSQHVCRGRTDLMKEASCGLPPADHKSTIANSAPKIAFSEHPMLRVTE